MERLSDSEIIKRLSKLPNWKYEKNKLVKEYKFSTFAESVSFVKLLQPVADGMNHHPDICIYYNRVLVELTTHDAGGVTDLDFLLAEKLEELSKYVKP